MLMPSMTTVSLGRTGPDGLQPVRSLPLLRARENTTLGDLCPVNQYQAEKTHMGCYRSKMRLRVHYPPIDPQHCVPGVVQVLAKTGYSQAILILLSAMVWTVFGERCLGETVIVCPENFREAIKPWITYRQRPSQAALFFIFPKANIAGFKNPGANRWCKTPKK